MKIRKWALACAVAGMGVTAQAQIGDGPVIREHVDQHKIDTSQMSFQEIFDKGEALFSAKFNTYDGQGRPGTTGAGAAREPGSAPAFIRTSAPESNSCAGCHNDPVVGGAGDIVANVFVLAQALDPVTDSVSAEFSNERNTLGMHGSGAIEMLAREMTADMHAIRDAAVAEASDRNEAVTKALMTKGVFFGSITANADGSLDTSKIEGVDADMIIKPFHQKGAVISIREFTNNAMNHHHGMQSVERFGVTRTGTSDFDQDGVPNELTVGDITATTVWQAGLGTPGQVIPNDPIVARAILRGERNFSLAGCDSCHVPALPLNSTVFSEPNPYNPAGNLQVDEVPVPYTWDMTAMGDAPRLQKRFDGTAMVRAFTDLKRYNLCDDELQHFCNEQLVQGGVPTEDFLTRKLWDVGSSAPFGHRGDLTTLTEAIWHHGGDARTSRDAYLAMSDQEQAEVIEFLKSLQILPAGTASLVVDENFVPKRASEATNRVKVTGPTRTRGSE
jgi:cytochrome c peroxidase